MFEYGNGFVLHLSALREGERFSACKPIGRRARDQPTQSRLPQKFTATK